MKARPNIFQITVLVAILAGVFLRFANLDLKVLWGDEALTIVRTSGYSVGHTIRQLSRWGEFTADGAQFYQEVNPEAELDDLVENFMGRARPPLYYLLVHEWRQWLGDSIAILRSFSALTGVISIVLSYWLAWELFHSPVTAAFTAALISVSPIHFLYSQEAREYSLLVAAILFSSAALLQAIRRESWCTWGLYTIATTLGLYTQWLFTFVLASHGIFILTSVKWREWRPKLCFVVVMLITGLMFSVWLVYAEFSPSKTLGEAGWTRNLNDWHAVVASWILNISRIFFDLNQALKLPSLPICIAVFAVVLVCFHYFWRQASRQAQLFVFSLIGVTAAALILPDLIDGGRGSTAMRYAFPCIIGVQMVVAFAFSTHLTFPFQSTYRRRMVAIGMICVLTLGIVSCAVSNKAEHWWNKYSGRSVIAVAHIINNAENPLVLTNTRGILSMSANLKPSIPIYWINTDRIQEENLGYTHPLSNYSDIFWYSAGYHRSKEMIHFFEESESFDLQTVIYEVYQIEPTFSTTAHIYKVVLEETTAGQLVDKSILNGTEPSRNP